jgi:hypothetical protein
MAAVPPPKEGATPSAARTYAEGYELRNVVSTLQQSSWADVQESFRQIAGGKCGRTALAWAACIGVLFAAHRFKMGGSQARMVLEGGTACCFTAMTQWYICRQADHDRRLTVRAYYERLASQRRSGGDVQEDDGADAAAGEAGDADASWKRELERLATYDVPRVVPGGSAGVTLR